MRDVGMLFGQTDRQSLMASIIAAVVAGVADNGEVAAVRVALRQS